MGHSDEWTFADYFRYEKEIYRAIISAAVALRWLIEHDFELPDDAGLKQMEAEVNRELCEAWGEIFSLAVLKWRDGVNSGPSADCEAAAVYGGFFAPKHHHNLNLWR